MRPRSGKNSTEAGWLVGQENKLMVNAPFFDSGVEPK